MSSCSLRVLPSHMLGPPALQWGVNETTAAELAGTTRGQTSDGYNYKAGMTYTTQPYLDAGVQPQTK